MCCFIADQSVVIIQAANMKKSSRLFVVFESFLEIFFRSGLLRPARLSPIDG
jgi:hypothetical protein